MNLAREYLYAAEMTDLLTKVVEKSEWEQVGMKHLGTLSKMFAHMCRVRNVYRDSLLINSINPPILFSNSSLFTNLISSFYRLFF